MKKLWDLKKVFSNLELEGQGRGIIMGIGNDMPTSARAILHHTDQKGPNILKGSVYLLFVYHSLFIFWATYLAGLLIRKKISKSIAQLQFEFLKCNEIWKNHTLYLVNSNLNGWFFQILWHSQNILTLIQIT